ncbi:hypothetical protein [Kribbella sp. CA-294648]|uniref:hypothetical protein n=1 Tax=Kribbella sp. CA-294648 TaxID=3239948 RepID=UPI003D8B0929
MTKPISNRSTHNEHVSNHSSAASTYKPIEQPSAANSKTKNSDTHHCITIKWSPDSASRRRDSVPPSAVSGAFGPVRGGGAAWL